ncbi:hypothetical protein [Psychromonas sp.]|uniref:hypothetical protein n=1 Tax=Psychromonas sp. TaxID=1884585 RepID=UPI003A971D3E
MKTLDQVTEVLHAWGISHRQINQFLDSDTAEQKGTQVIAIEKCLELLYPELKQKQRFLTTSSKIAFFEGREPLDVILSGNLEQMESAYRVIRSMLCI